MYKLIPEPKFFNDIETSPSTNESMTMLSCCHRSYGNLYLRRTDRHFHRPRKAVPETPQKRPRNVSDMSKGRPRGVPASSRPRRPRGVPEASQRRPMGVLNASQKPKAHGPRIEVHGPMPKAHSRGSRLKAQGPRSKDQGPRLKVQGSIVNKINKATHMLRHPQAQKQLARRDARST